MGTIADNLQAVRARIERAARAAGRPDGAVTLVAVSKTFSAEHIAQAHAAGQRVFGENYAQEAVEKITALADWPLVRRVAQARRENEIAPSDAHPSAGVASREGPLLLPLEWRGTQARRNNEIDRSAAHPSAGVASPEGPLLLPLEWRGTQAQRNNEIDQGAAHPSAGVASPEGPLLLPLEWHFIGPIQSNKTALIAQHFDWVHSIEREKIAQRLDAARPPGLPPLEVCIQVNVSGEGSKSGVAPGGEIALADAIARLPRLRLRGLMAIPEPTPDPALQRKRFALLRELKDRLAARGYPVDTLSMGMSDDLEAAIAEGATMVRVGTAIFGSRKK